MASVGIIESNIILKQGDTFAIAFTMTDSEGNASTGNASKLKSQVRDKVGGTLYGELSIGEYDDIPGKYFAKSGNTNNTQDTSTWKIGDAYFDIQYTDGDIVNSTQTVKFKIVGDVTV